MPHNAYNPRRSEELQSQPAAHWVPAMKGTLRKKLIDDDDRLCAKPVLLGKHTTTQKRDSHGVKVAWGGRVGEGHGDLIEWRRCGACPVLNLVLVSAEWNDAIDGCGLNSRNHLRFIQDLLPGGAHERGI